MRPMNPPEMPSVRWGRAALLAGACALASGCAWFTSKHADKADTHYEQGNYCEAAEHYNVALRKEPSDPTLVQKRDQAARRCAASVLDLARTSLRQNQVGRALETYDGFYFQTDAAQGLGNDMIQAVRSGYEEAQGRFLAFAKESPDRIKMVHYLAPRLKSDVVKRWFEPYQQEVAEYHAAIGRRTEVTMPARAVLHFRLADVLGGTAQVSKRLWSRATQRLIPPVNWKPFQHCWKEAKAIVEGLSGGVGDPATGTLDLTACEAIDETVKEEVETSTRPEAQYTTRAVQKVALVTIRPNGMVDFDPVLFSDCVGADVDGGVSATCWISPTFRYRRKDQLTMTFHDAGPHRIPWTDQMSVPVALPGEATVKKRVDRLRAGFEIAGNLRLQFGELSEHRTLRVELVEVGRPGEVAHGDAMRGETLGRATERLRDILAELVPSNFISRARAEENAGKLDEAEQAYLAWSLTTGQLKSETLDYVMRRYGLDREAVSALFHFQPQ